MSNTKKTPATPSERAPSKRPSASKAKKAAAAPTHASLSLIDPPGVAPINARKVRPVPALLPSVRAARLLDPADEAQASPTDEPTPLHAIHLNPEAVSLEAFLSRLAPQHPARSSVNTLSSPIQRRAPAPSPRGKPAAEPASQREDDVFAPSSPLFATQASTTKLHRPIDPATVSSQAPRSSGQTLAERLEMSKLAREAEANAMADPVRLHAPAAAPIALPLPATLPRPTMAEPAGPLALAPDAPTSSSGSIVAARDTLVGVALAYVDDFQLHIGGPVASLWRHKASIAAAMVHVFIPLLMAYGFSHWNPSMQAIFLEGGLLANLGKLCWLFIISAFGWTLTYIIGARMLQSLKFDWGRFERIGRGFMSSHRHDE